MLCFYVLPCAVPFFTISDRDSERERSGAEQLSGAGVTFFTGAERSGSGFNFSKSRAVLNLRF